MELFVSTQNTMKTQVGVLRVSSGAGAGHQGRHYGKWEEEELGWSRKGFRGSGPGARPCHRQAGVTELVM